MAADATGRADYDATVQFAQFEVGEPIFVIRGKDRVAGPAVRAWAALASRAGAPEAIVESALQQADRLDAWPTKKLPDADHLSDDEVKQLRYQLQRRAWNHRTAQAPTETSLLAEQRGAAAAIAGERHADDLLASLVERLTPHLARIPASDRPALQQTLELILQDLERRKPRPPAAPAPSGELVAFPSALPAGEFAVSVFEADQQKASS